jgi:hypothetical protein
MRVGRGKLMKPDGTVQTGIWKDGQLAEEASTTVPPHGDVKPTTATAADEQKK